MPGVLDPGRPAGHSRGLVVGLVCLAAILPATALAQGPRFYPDDPLAAEPAPLPVGDVQPRALSMLLEAVSASFTTTGQRHPDGGVIPAQGLNTLGEVMDGDWYVNRHARRRMTIAQLQQGPRGDRPPVPDGPLQVLVVRRFGFQPGLLVADGRNELYVLRFDVRGYAGLTTGAQIVASRFLHALGYHVSEDYLLTFDRQRLVIHESGQAMSSAGRRRPLTPEDVDAFLRELPAGPGGTYRAVATRVPERRQALLGPFQVWGTRSDDPNDTVPHEHRRDLRGLFVFAAWLNLTEARAVSTQDVLVSVDGVDRVRHFFVNLTSALGSRGFGGPKPGWQGHELVHAGLGGIARNIASLGVVTPAWMREKHPRLPEVGTFGSQTFDPEAWTTTEPVPPFVNRLPDDTFWAARQVMAFTDEEIRAIVQVGRYSRDAEDWITATLIERRNRIGRTYFNRVLPLHAFHVTDNGLVFDDLAVVHGLATPRQYSIEWLGFDNAKDALLQAIGTGPMVPAAAQALAAGSYVAARIHAGDPAMHVLVYLRRRAESFDVVGIERAWPGKVIAIPPPPPRADQRVYADLAARQRSLFETYVTGYNAARGSQYSPEEAFMRLTISEQTTFYGVTHALMNSSLTDERGAALGAALDLVTTVDRIAGQYAGRGGDQQFRLYVNLKPGARDVLANSREFYQDHDNTVYHVGYPYSYRQVGKEPNLQLSLSEDGLRADIDVDYRSSRSPQALFNGHLTSANSDVRAGENPRFHNGRWQGLVAWWQDLFGMLADALPGRDDALNRDRPEAPAAPLPPDRPRDATPERIEDAVQEFLTDWLVRHDYDQALEFLSPKAYACVNRRDDGRSETLDAAGAREELRRLMAYSRDALGQRPDLANAIVAIESRRPDRKGMDHPFRGQFLLGPLPEAEARTYLCSQSAAPPAGTEFYGVAFQFLTDGGGVLGLLWTREDGAWKIVAYQPLRQ
jgi:hypothetical protein